jgi:oxygen-dependent protoporphyrinogen oxidase
LRCTLLEKTQRLGGLIRTDTIQGCRLEAGPDSYIATKPAVTDLARQLAGLEGEIIGSNDDERRIYIVRDGHFLPLPPGMRMMVPGNMKAAFESPLFAAGTKLRFLAEVFSKTHARESDISVQQLVTDHFGSEVLEYITEPLLSGVYGGDVSQLSAQSVLPSFIAYERTYGSLIRGVRREQRAPAHSGSLFLTFRNGMQTLTDALSNAIADATEVVHQHAFAVERTPAGWLVRCNGSQFTAAHIVIATPAYVAADLLNDSLPELSQELSGIPYSSAILATLGYRRSDATTPPGFGFLVPRRERQTVAATTFVGTKWPTRVPDDLVALRAFIVEPESTRLLVNSDQEVLESVRGDFRRLLEISEEPVFSTIERWPRSMPQYVVGHQARQRRIADILSANPGVHLTGNAYTGVGVPECVRMANETANKIQSSGAAVHSV